MSEGIPYADIVVLALIAGFILLRLRSILGQKSDNEPDFFKRQMPSAAKLVEPIVQVNEKSLKPKPPEENDRYLATLGDSAVATTLNAIKAKDAQFNATDFLNGAKLAFEMVFDAFAKGDKPTLKMLLADSVYKTFSDEIDARTTQENHNETTLISVKAEAITQAIFASNVVKLTVQFLSEQVTVVRNTNGDIIEGKPSDIHHADDDWVFERDVTSKNPNWKIIET